MWTEFFFICGCKTKSINCNCVIKQNLRPFQNEVCITIKEVLLFLCLEYTLLLDVSLEFGQTEHKNLFPLEYISAQTVSHSPSLFCCIYTNVHCTSASSFQAFEVSQIFSCISCIQIYHSVLIFAYWCMTSLKSPKQTLYILWWIAGLSFIMKFALKRKDKKRVLTLPHEKQQRP